MCGGGGVGGGGVVSVWGDEEWGGGGCEERLQEQVSDLRGGQGECVVGGGVGGECVGG